MPVMNPEDVRFFSGRSHPLLAAEIANYLSIPLEETHFREFSNDNLEIQLCASVRGRAVFIIQSLVAPVSERILELFMMLDIAHGAGAREVHAIIPYYSYARSDKKDAPRISITARLIADLLQTAGATHVMMMTLHSPQVHGFFSMPTDPLSARGLFVRYYLDQNLDPDSTIVVAPDMGRAKSAGRFASLLGCAVAAADKRRISDNSVIIGESISRQVTGYKKALIYDDEIATGSTVLELSRSLIQSGIEEISLICTHGLFTGNAIQRITEIEQINEIVTTNTVPIPDEKKLPIMRILSVAPIFGEAIWRNSNRQSIGDLFSFAEDI
jgi:ribose-phosphate pyrophosphokinase